MKGVEALRATKSRRSLRPFWERDTPSLVLARVLSTMARAVGERQGEPPHPLWLELPRFVTTGHFCDTEE